MGLFAAILGGIGGLCAVMGVVTALEVIEPIMDQMDMIFWLMLSAILLLGSIAAALGRNPEGG